MRAELGWHAQRCTWLVSGAALQHTWGNMLKTLARRPQELGVAFGSSDKREAELLKQEQAKAQTALKARAGDLCMGQLPDDTLMFALSQHLMTA